MIELVCPQCKSSFFRRAVRGGRAPMCPTCRPQAQAKWKREYAERIKNENVIEKKSWKEVTELYMKELDKDFPEGQWVDPAEADLE